ncbi:hypoxanthine-guanine phosphoribosyltransferase [Spiroplasma helicoides]|uniref:Hypoxanthine phosphoribosyltransferase n=1 Tax=Spiroplasma helicoides TaxID=216938 RepID=A0A1B3SKV1_9MOLU|nr:hypoxanthine phosphoribosyltransferase [Spiroplasma helicoides]AOG60545.1 hypoxanthine-guanine phosphoribosyltransferase [Spiroplasma helicoides]
MHPLVKEVLYTEEQIKERIKELGKEISEYYIENNQSNDAVIMLGLLRGCITFMGNFLTTFTPECEIDFMTVSSYSGTESSGKLKITQDVKTSLKDRTVLIVEDIIDTGLTLEFVKDYLYSQGARDVKVVVLFDKPGSRKNNIQADWRGFSIKNDFVIGFGFDIDNKLRNLPYVGICDTDKLKDWKW